MTRRQSGAIPLFRLFGIDVSLHWSWFIVAIFELQIRGKDYGSIAWNAAEYVSLFVIVLLHEFGHALACRSVGGQANRILLWPFGGIAFVNPPPRPGALLWSIVAGPLVNVILVPVTLILVISGNSGALPLSKSAEHYLHALATMNILLLAFNLLPIYPLDGGQILRALLWFFIGPAKSLMTAAVIGMIGVAGGVILLLSMGSYDPLLLLLAAFAGLQCFNGFKQARALSRQLTYRPRENVRCPVCGQSPPIGAFWQCDACGNGFDAFAAAGACPNCGHVHDTTGCGYCRQRTPTFAWSPSSVFVVPGPAFAPPPPPTAPPDPGRA